jgi:hypothetical protein
MEYRTNFGEIIDLSIRASKNTSEEKQRYLKYIEDIVAKGAELSSRQITRMRKYSYEEFPEERSLRQLIKFLPELELINPTSICNRLILPWGNIEIDQDKLPNESVITIFAGWEEPEGISNKDITKSIAENIDKKDFKYRFIFPNLKTYRISGENKQETDVEEKAKSRIKGWIKLLQAKVSGMWYSSETGRLVAGDDKENIKLDDFEKKLESNIKGYSSSENTNIWFLLPSPYSVFYNLAETNKPITSKHGIFKVEGTLLSCGERNVHTDGWLLTNQEQYNRLEQSFNINDLDLLD